MCLPPNTFSALQPLNVACYGPAKREWCRILSSFYRDSRQETVQKPAFPRLLKVLFEKAFFSKPENLMSGFRKTGLYIQVNKNAILKRKLLPCKTLISNLEQPTTSTSTSHSATNEPVTRHKVMRLAIISSICPPISDSTRKALQKAGRKRSRVQKKYGEVLTLDTSLQKLQEERENRRRKKSKSS